MCSSDLLFEFGADIVTHSTTKYMDGHAVQGGGIIVDSGNFDWTKGNFPGLTEPDITYHGLSYTETYGKAAYILKARMQLMRDFGCYPAAHSAFLLNLGLEMSAKRTYFAPLLLTRSSSLRITGFLYSSMGLS